MRIEKEMYNLNHLLKIEVQGFTTTRNMKYKSQLKVFGVVVMKQGFYDSFGKRIDVLPKCYKMLGRKVYLKPKVVLKFLGGLSIGLHQESLQKAKRRAEEIATTKDKYLFLKNKNNADRDRFLQ